MDLFLTVELDLCSFSVVRLGAFEASFDGSSGIVFFFFFFSWHSFVIALFRVCFTFSALLMTEASRWSRKCQVMLRDSLTLWLINQVKATPLSLCKDQGSPSHSKSSFNNILATPCAFSDLVTNTSTHPVKVPIKINRYLNS